MNSHPTVIHWFRQDLRISDNPALFAACEKGDVLPIYILDDENSGAFKMGGASRVWLHHSLISLNKSLKGKLSVYAGNPLDILLQLCKRYNVASIYWSRCYEPWRINRDTKIKKSLQQKGVEVTQLARNNGFPLAVKLEPDV